MGLYLITGASTGIGAALNERLKGQGHDTLTVDVGVADICADLSTPDGRMEMSRQVQEFAAEGLDGFIPCAGVGPHLSNELLVSVNYFGVRAAWDCAWPLLQKKNGTAVLISSNSAPMNFENRDLIDAMLADDEPKALEIAKKLEGTPVYAGGKRALAYWMRKNCGDWIAQGVRVNAIAPGMTLTPLVTANFSDPKYQKLMQQFKDSIPAKRMADPEEMAAMIDFLLGDESAYCCGSVLIADGGIDATSRIECFE